MAELKRPIVIAGGGLAGLSLAVALRQRNVPVRVLEAGHYPRHRVCGEFISGVSPETLESLGIKEAFEGALLHHRLAWHDQGRLIHRARLEKPALGISRHLLDERLQAKARRLGAEIITGHRASPEPNEGSVWAAGRKARNGPWIGLKGHVKLPGMQADVADLEMHQGTNGYVGLAGVEEGWTNVCGLFRLDRSIRAKGSALLTTYIRAGGNRELAAHLECRPWREDSFSAVAGFQTGRQPEAPGILALGDAESMIPPFTGNGMSMAFESAEIAVPHLAAWSGGELSWQEASDMIRRGLRRKFRRRLAAAGGLHHLLLAPAGRMALRGLSSTGMLPFRAALALVR